MQPGEMAADAAQIMLGDRRLTNEIEILHGIAYVRGEKHGPPAKWAADPKSLE